MARRDNNANNELANKMHNIIAFGTKIVGTITSDGDIRIDGEVEGEISTNARVILGKTSNVNGSIICTNAEILGHFTGKLTVAETLSIRDTATISGDIITSKITIDVNAKFNGTCNMNSKETASLKTKKEDKK